MRRLLFFIIVLTAAIWVGLLLKGHPGYVLIAYDKWTVETSLWFAVLSLVLSLLAIYIIVRIFSALFNLSTRFGRWRHRWQKSRMNKAMREGYCDMIVGKYA